MSIYGFTSFYVHLRLRTEFTYKFVILRNFILNYVKFRKITELLISDPVLYHLCTQNLK